jgi:RecA/RadA recombinase
MATKKKTSDKKSKKKKSKSAVAKLIAEADKGSDMTPIALQEHRGRVLDALSTGSLVLDLNFGGGWAPGKVGVPVGPESGGKSTLLFSTLCQAMVAKIPVVFIDAEGSLDRTYLENIGFDWDRYVNDLFFPYWPATGEHAFKHMRKILKGLDNRKDGRIQIVFMIDSAPALVPEAEDSGKGAIAERARMFSQYMPLVKTLLAKKRALLLITNQLRFKPGVMFGNPEYNPCGEALKHYTDQRPKIVRFSKQLADKNKVKGLGVGGIEQEPHVSGEGFDNYMYSKVTTLKNKAFPPMKTGEIRLWFLEQNGVGRGIDPVYDTFMYLTMTGQINVDRKKYVVTLPGFEGKYDWRTFKRLVLKPTYTAKMSGLEVHDRSKPAVIDACREQIMTSEAFDLRRRVEMDGKVVRNYIWGVVKGPAKTVEEDGSEKLVGILVELEDGTDHVVKSKAKEDRINKRIGESLRIPV